MLIVSRSPFVPRSFVTKARAPAKRQVQLTYELADEYIPNYAAWMRNMVKRMRGIIPADPSKFPVFDPKRPRAIPAYYNAMTDARELYTSLVVDSGNRALELAGAKIRITKAKEKGTASIPINPHAQAWADKRSAGLVQYVSSKQREAIRSVIGQSFGQNRTVSNTAKQIKTMIGLTPVYAGAVEKRRAAMVDAGASQERADKEADRYAEKLLNRRAETIARTETVEAQAEGQQRAWEQAADQGLLPAGVKMRWMSVHDERLSDICSELDGQTVALGEAFYSEVLGEEVERPPAHPNCRAIIVLEFD